MTEQITVRLWITPTLPQHYVAERSDRDGLWLLPVAPVGDNWHQARPYHGNYTLTPAPEYITRFYAPRHS